MIFPILPKRELHLLGKSHRELDDVLRWDDSVFHAVAEKVSLWSAAQHAWHVASANLMMFSAIEKLYKDESDDILRDGGPTIPGRLVLTTGFLPRGRDDSVVRISVSPGGLGLPHRTEVRLGRPRLALLELRKRLSSCLRNRPAPLEAPPEILRPDAIRLFQQSKAMMTALASRAPFLHEPKGRLNHFVLGNLTALQWLRFSRIHTQHHLGFIRELRKALPEGHFVEIYLSLSRGDGESSPNSGDFQTTI